MDRSDGPGRAGGRVGVGLGRGGGVHGVYGVHDVHGTAQAKVGGEGEGFVGDVVRMRGQKGKSRSRTWLARFQRFRGDERDVDSGRW